MTIPRPKRAEDRMSAPSIWRIATDTGGTFTDCHAIDPEGRESRCKVLSTGRLRAVVMTDGSLGGLPPLPKGFVESLQQIPPGIQSPGTLLELTTNEEAPVLGVRILTNTPPGKPFPPLQLRIATTRATNALLERKGGRVALYTTAGFGDLLEIGDQRRGDLFALDHTPRPLFHEVVLEVDERVSVKGELLRDISEVPDCAEGITTAAVSLLHGHAFPEHERKVAATLRGRGFKHVVVSHETAAFSRLLPRTQSTVADAYLHEPVQGFLDGVQAAATGDLQVMTSAGGLKSASAVRPKDMLLSGPAGGAIGAANAAKRFGFGKIITLDMGGTSTDVTRIEGRPSYRFTQDVAGMKLMAPCIAIETVAAGGGSVCRWSHHGLQVGPQSAGADPGPACYGKGGPLTITDVNLLMRRFDPARAPIPLSVEAAEARLLDIQRESGMERQALLQTLLRLAVEHMTDAIRRISISEGYDPSDYALLAFGGAGPQHACAVAESLGMKTILVPEHAGILSAVGLQQAVHEDFHEKEVCRSLCDFLDEGFTIPGGASCMAEMRLKGQDTPVQVSFERIGDLPQLYRDAYQRLFGYPPPEGREIEVVSVRWITGAIPCNEAQLDWRSEVIQPADGLIQDAFSTLVVGSEWSVERIHGFGHVMRFNGTTSPSETLGRDLLRHRFHSIVSDMGALLQRTAISTNIRERLDFSCALLDAEGRLMSSAPHIPVHLGALGVCVRAVIQTVGLNPGDTVITNHPGYGGSHLPDVTLISPVHDDQERLIGFIANRAHHAEIGGMTPGSMPAHAKTLAEEGVVIVPRHLVKDGRSCFDEVEALLLESKYPTRNLADNLADLHAQLAANMLGVRRFRGLISPDLSVVMKSILDHSASVMKKQISRLPIRADAEETLDDGSRIVVSMRRHDAELRMDFTGTSPVHSGNLNATEAIVRSAVLYVMRLMLQEDIPLNEGIMEPVRIDLPVSLLKPSFTGDSSRDPAVVGGNVEVSQRLVDTLIKALAIQACSQGTMNNFLFGGDGFGYYETIAGGSGAGNGYHGASAVHTHMTNTAITDPEILEQRYPVRLRQFSILKNSGGAGQWRGGDGVVREFEFLSPLTVSLLTQHRRSGPFGMEGGACGTPGIQWHVHRSVKTELPSSASFDVRPGDRVIIHTPGGGGYGTAHS